MSGLDGEQPGSGGLRLRTDVSHIYFIIMTSVLRAMCLLLHHRCSGGR